MQENNINAKSTEIYAWYFVLLKKVFRREKQYFFLLTT